MCPNGGTGAMSGCLNVAYCCKGLFYGFRR
jgi:hypothetical protein